MHITKSIYRPLLCLVMGSAIMLSQAASPPAVNLQYSGNLVAEPCVVQPGDEDIRLDFGNIIDKYLYLNIRTPGHPFEIHLNECDLTLGNVVSVIFQGAENNTLPGLLAIGVGSQAKGIAIGLETLQAKPLPLNKESDKYHLQKGSNVIAQQAYVRGEPGAINQQSIERGPFNAVATFILEYE